MILLKLQTTAIMLLFFCRWKTSVLDSQLHVPGGTKIHPRFLGLSHGTIVLVIYFVRSPSSSPFLLSFVLSALPFSLILLFFFPYGPDHLVQSSMHPVIVAIRFCVVAYMHTLPHLFCLSYS